MTKKRIGIFGGMFNPIHIGHLHVAQIAQQAKGLDLVYFVPSYLPPDKQLDQKVTARQRLEMVRLATQGNPGFKVSDFEVKKSDVSYSIETVKHFRAKFPHPHELFFIIGADRIKGLPAWQSIGEILKMLSFLAVHRPGTKTVERPYPVEFLPAPGLEISSTYLRDHTRTGHAVSYLLPESVRQYVKKYRLYENV